LIIARETQVQGFNKVTEKLRQKYGLPRKPARRSLVEHILLELAREFASDQTAVRIVNRLGREFVDWNELRVSGLDEISEAIGRYRYSRRLAQLIKEFLQKCFDESHDLELSVAQNSSTDRVNAALARLDIDATVGGSALLDWAEEEDLPVTTDLSRVLQRLAFVKNHASPAAVRRQLEDLVPPGEKYAAYRLLHEHGVAVCISRKFDCSICTLRNICPRGKIQLSKRKQTHNEDEDRNHTQARDS